MQLTIRIPDEYYLRIDCPAKTLFGGFIYSGHQAMLFDKLDG